MQIDIRGQNVAISGSLAAHCLDRLDRALRPFSTRVERVQVVFVQLNGLRKGPGRACRATVHLSTGNPLRFESRSEDYYQAASETIAGISSRLPRELARRRDQRLWGGGPTLPAA